MEYDDDLKIWCGNLDPEVEEDTLYELFLQVAPLNRVQIMSQSKTGKPTNYAFITVKHKVSVDYVTDIMNGVKLFGKPLVLRARNNSKNDDNRSNDFRNFNNEVTPRHDMIDQLCNLAPQLIAPNVMFSNFNSPQSFDLRHQIDDYRNFNDKPRHHSNDKFNHSRDYDNQDDYRGRNDYRHQKDDYRSHRDYKRNDRREDFRNHRGKVNDNKRGEYKRHGNYKPYHRR